MAINIPIVSQYNAKGVNDANKSLGSFDKSVKALGKSLAGVFAAKQVISFFASSIKGAIEDEASLRKLNKTLQNMGFAGSADQVDKFVNKLQFSAAVADDQLRPALNNLIISTGNLTKSQQLLQLSLDVSSGSGRDLDSITQALAKAYNGNYTALKKMNLGIDESLIKNKDLNGIITILGQKFAGASADAVDTYAGKIKILSLAVNEAKETIGYALLNALDKVSGNTQDFALEIQGLGQDIADLITGVVVVTEDIYNFGASLGFANTKTKSLMDDTADLGDKIIGLIPILAPYLKYLKDAGEAERLAFKPAQTSPAGTRLAAAARETQKALDALEPSTKKTEKAIKGLTDAQKGLINANIKVQDSIVNNLQTSLSSAENSLSAVTNKFDDLNSTISGSVTDIVDFGKALETGNFIDAITKQAQDATGFADKVKQLIVMGLSERGIRELLNAGFDAGSLIADQLIAGGTTVIQQINTLLDSVNVVAETVGRLGAQTFYQQGVDQGNALVDGIKASLASAQAELDRLRESLTAPGKATAASSTGDGVDTGAIPPPTKDNPPPKQLTQMEKIIQAAGGAASTSASRSYTAMAAAMGKIRLAKGGIVTGPTNALIGEAGPEAVIPLSGRNGGLGQTFNITVNAGVGTNGAQVGQQIVEAIKKYERTSGQVFARA